MAAQLKEQKKIIQKEFSKTHDVEGTKKMLREAKSSHLSGGGEKTGLPEHDDEILS